MTSSLSRLDNRFPPLTHEIDPKKRNNTIFLVRQDDLKFVKPGGDPLVKGAGYFFLGWLR